MVDPDWFSECSHPGMYQLSVRHHPRSVVDRLTLSKRRLHLGYEPRRMRHHYVLAIRNSLSGVPQ